MNENKDSAALLLLETYFSVRNILKYESPEKDKKLSIAQFNILATLNQVEKLQMRLCAEMLNIRLSNLSKYVDELIKSGYIKKTICENDRRIVYIYLTDRGREILRRYIKVFTKCLSERLSCFSDNEISEISQSLSTIKEFMYKYRELENNF